MDDRNMMAGIVKTSLRVLLLAVCSVSLSSCGTIGSLLSYLISLPMNIIDAIIP